MSTFCGNIANIYKIRRTILGGHLKNSEFTSKIYVNLWVLTSNLCQLVSYVNYVGSDVSKWDNPGSYLAKDLSPFGLRKAFPHGSNIFSYKFGNFYRVATKPYMILHVKIIKVYSFVVRVFQDCYRYLFLPSQNILTKHWIFYYSFPSGYIHGSNITRKRFIKGRL